MSYEEQLSAAKFRAERDLARQERERLRERLRDSVPREAYERKRAAWLRQIRECETALHRRRECIKKLESAALESRAVREEDREAAEWVRGHGGIEELRRMFQDADSRRVELCGALGIDLDKGWSEAMAAMRLRLMPEGMEWPCYESGEPVIFESMIADDRGGSAAAMSFEFSDDRVYIRDFEGFPSQMLAVGERVKRSAPEVLDSEGVECNVGDAVWWVHNKTGNFRITRIDKYGKCAIHDDDPDEPCGMTVPSTELTHKRPVLDADGVEIRVGDRLYDTDTGCGRTVLAADGRQLREGETVWDTNGDGYVVERIYSGTTEPDFPGHTVACRRTDDIVTHMFKPSQLTHQRPDSWERLEEDAEKNPCDYFGFDWEETCGKCPASGKNCEQTMARDLVRRAKKLAGVSE